MCASNPSGVIVSSAGCKRNASSSSERSDAPAAKQTIAVSSRVIFVVYAHVVERNDGTSIGARLERAPLQLSACWRWPCRRFLLLLIPDTNLFQAWLNRLFPAEEFLDGNVYIARIARLVNFAAQFHAGLLIEIAVLRLFKNCGHISGDGVSPGVAVVTGIVAIQMSKVAD